jgi:hypothetical protein
MNQFKQAAAVGEVDLQTNPNPNIFTARFYDVSATALTTLVPGEGTILVDLGASDFGGVPIVDERAADSDTIFGIKTFSTKKNDAESNDIVQVAGSGTVIWMNAGAAIVRGASVALVLATPGNVITRTTETIAGTALDKATGANQLIRVLVA